MRPGQLKVLKARELSGIWGMFRRLSILNSGCGTKGSSKSPERRDQQLLMFDKAEMGEVIQEIMEKRFFFDGRRTFRDLAISKPCKLAVCY